jgi:D-xylose transport system substrate-binding protein
MKRENFSLVSIIVFLTMFAMSLMTFLPHGGAREAEAQNMKIGFILKTMQEERYQTDKALFIASAEALGAQVLFDSSSNNELTQLQQVEKMLEEGIQLLVLQPVKRH